MKQRQARRQESYIGGEKFAAVRSWFGVVRAGSYTGVMAILQQLSVRVAQIQWNKFRVANQS